jgi:MipA family protein
MQLNHSWTFLALLAAADVVRAQDEQAVPATRREWDAAIGAVANYGPQYAGADRYAAGLQPGLYLRWGRVSLATRSAFVTRTNDAAPRGGLRVELGGGQRWRASVGLRLASGRSESASDALRGLGDVRNTVRARVSLNYRLSDGWRLGAGWSTDVLGRDGGWLADAGFSREHSFGDATRWSWGAGINFAGRRYQQTFFGVTPEQSGKSGYAVYSPGAGLRDAGLFINARHDLSRHWFVFGSVGASTLLGPSADSPIVRRRVGASISSGVAYRF